MAADHTTEIARLKAAITEMLQRVPPSVCAAGMSATKAYKEVVSKAQKVLTNSRATLANTQQSYTNLAGYWNR